MRTRRGNALSWVALVVAVFALIIAFIAVRRPSGVTLTTVEDRIGTLQTELETRLSASEQVVRERLSLENARLQLFAFRAELEAGRTQEAVADDVVALHERLSTNLSDAQGDLKAAWDKLDEGMTTLETKLREGASDTRQALDTLIQDVGSELRKL